MNIETLLEAAKYVESGGVLDCATGAEHSFTRGKDEVDSAATKRSHSYTPSILEKQLTGSSPPKRARTKSPALSYNETGPAHQHSPSPSQLETSQSLSVPVSSSIIQHAPRYPAASPPGSYHLYMPPQPLQQHHVQQHPQHQVHRSQNPQISQHIQQHPRQPALNHQHQQGENQPPQRYASVSNPTVQTHPPIPPPSQPPSQPLLSPALAAVSSSRFAGPSQALDLLKLAESQGGKYTTLTNMTSPRGRGSPGSQHGIISPGSHHGNMSPRLVHQIVSHNQWVAGERPASPKQSPKNLKPSGDSDSNDSANDGSGKDKRAGIREVHNKLEKNRRAHLKECFENLQKAIPNMEDKKTKTSNLSILRGALKHIQVLTRKERELEHELDRLVRQKIEAQQRLDLLKIKNGLTIGKPIKLPVPSRVVEEEEEEEVVDEDDDEERLVVVEEKEEVDVVADDGKKVEVDDDQASTSTASEAEEEERKSRTQSRSESPLHHPVSSSHLIHPTLPGASTAYQQAFASFQGAIKETPPYTNPASRPLGLSRSANEAMLGFSTMRDAQIQQGSDPTKHKHKHPGGALMKHGSAPSLAPSLAPVPSTVPSQRTTYMQMSQDKVSTMLQSVANQISPGVRSETVGGQSSGAVAGSVTRQTVSQLLGKQPVVRQPVRRQLSVPQLPVIQSPLQTPHQLLPRIMSTTPLRLGFNPTTSAVVGPSKPVVTVGINSFLAQPSVIQTTSTHKTVISNGSAVTTPDLGAPKQTTPSVITASPLTTPVLTTPLVTSALGTSSAATASSAGLMTASVITQTLPVMSHPGHSQFIPPIALQSPANASLLFTNPSSYIGLPHSMLPQPFLGSFATARPSHIQLATSTQVSPSLATTQPLVHPSTQSLDSANLLALAQALPKQIPPAQLPSALSITSLASQGALLPTNLSTMKHTPFTTVVTPTTVQPAAPTAKLSQPLEAKKKQKSVKSPKNKLGKGLNGKMEIQITTSKIAETMATLANKDQVIAKNGHSTSTVNSRSTQQSVVVKL